MPFLAILIEELNFVCSPDENGIPKSEGIAVAWDIVDSGTGFVRCENLVAPNSKSYIQSIGANHNVLISLQNVKRYFLNC